VGIPIITDLKGCYSVAESHLRRFADDADDACLAGRKKRRGIVNIASFTGLLRRFRFNGISREARSEVLAAVEARI
jgi:hypothetical protein